MKPNLLKFARPLAIAGIILANIYILQNTWLGIFFSLGIFYFYGQRLGTKMFQQFDSFFQTVYGAFLFLAVNSIILWIAFYLYAINSFVIVGSVFFTCLAVEYLYKRQTIPKIKINFNISIWFIGFIGFLIGSFSFLFKVSTDQAISSPWNLLNNIFFVYFIFTTLFLILFLLRSNNSGLKKISLVLYSSLFAGIAVIVYKIGYGYDPFLHLAAMKNILVTGTLVPKTIYYIGEYSSLIFLSNITQVSIEFLNKIFLPLIWAVLFPTTIYYSLTKGLKLKEKFVAPAVLGAFLLPINYFILTTPQGLTNLLCLVIIFLSFTNVNRIFLFILGIFTFAIHPLFGVPILVYVSYLYFKEHQSKIVSRFLSSAIAIGGLIVFPVLFLANSIVNGFKISLKWPNLSEIVSIPIWQDKHQFRFVEDLLYTIGANLKLIFILCVIITIVLLISRKEFKQFKVHFWAGLIVFVNYFTTKLFINFDFATNQNQTQFLQRIFELALYFWLPIFIYLIYILFKQSWSEKNNLTVKVFVLTLLLLITTTSLYFSYPVKNDYKDSKEYNVTKADIEAVQLIKNHAVGSYIVLGNQMLAAAAIRENGFAHYYNNEFYYSIPSGNEQSIYQYFEKMVFDHVDLKYIIGAKNLTCVENVYFVLPTYWSNSNNIISNAKWLADDYFTTDNESNYIFYFKINSLDVEATEL